MQLICPKCGSRFVLEQAVSELEQAETHDIAAKLGVHWHLVYEYSDCFRQSEFGNVPLPRRLRIFKGIARLMETSEFSYRGKRYRTSQHEMIKAMTEICNMQKQGLRNQSYLFAILSKAGERLSAEGMTAREEEEREQGRRGADGQRKDAIGLEKAIETHPELKKVFDKFGKD